MATTPRNVAEAWFLDKRLCEGLRKRDCLSHTPARRSRRCGCWGSTSTASALDAAEVSFVTHLNTTQKEATSAPEQRTSVTRREIEVKFGTHLDAVTRSQRQAYQSIPVRLDVELRPDTSLRSSGSARAASRHLETVAEASSPKLE